MSSGNSPNAKRPALWNLIFVSVAFLLIFSAYASLEVVQSSLNAGVGVQSLCAIYSSFVVCSLVLPPLIINKLGYKNSMALGVVGYGGYTAANFHPQPYVLIPAGIVVGAAASLLWAATRVYVTNLAYHAAGESGKRGEKRVGFYFGIFYCIYNCSGMGNIIMSLLLTPQEPQNQPPNNATRNISFAWQTTTYVSTVTNSDNYIQNTTVKLCGASASDQWTSNSGNDADDDDGDNPGTDVTMLYILLTVYLVFAAMAGLLLMFAIDEVPPFKPEQYDSGESKEETAIDRNANKELIPEESKRKENSETNKTSGERGGSYLVLATLRLFKTNTQLQLMIPSTIQFGVFHSLISASYMRFWVTCSLGIEYVGYAALVYGITSSLMAFSVGRLLRWLRRRTIFFAACILEVLSLVVLLIWSPPEEATQKYLFFIFIAVFSFTYTAHRCINQTAFSSFFVQDADAGQSATAFLDSIGRAIIFGVTPFVDFKILLYVLFTLLALSVVTYYLAERSHSKRLKAEERRIETSDLEGGNQTVSDDQKPLEKEEVTTAFNPI